MPISLQVAITTGLPYAILRKLLGDGPDHFVSTRVLFLTQRLAFVVITLIIDWAVVRMARQIRRSPSIALLLVSSSYVTLTYHTHAFSNTVETLVLALSAAQLGAIIQHHDLSITSKTTLATAYSLQDHKSPAKNASTSSPLNSPRTTPALLSFGLGVLFALGFFTRITFILFGAPLGVMFLYLNFLACFPKGQRSNAAVGFLRFCLSCLPLALGMIAFSFSAILIDSIYFGKLEVSDALTGMRLSLVDFLGQPQNWTRLQYSGSFTVTMLNNLKYNLDPSNLAQHGLHPWYLHLFLNYPVLFGNLAYIGVKTLLQKAQNRQLTSDSKLVTALSYSGIFGIVMLSTKPHQEARFLTPLILPLIICLSSRISKLGRKFWAGVVPSIALVQEQSLGFQNCQPVAPNGDHIYCITNPSHTGEFHTNDSNSYSTHVIFYKTYMPPLHLFGYNMRQSQEGHKVAVKISDWREKDRQELLVALGVATAEQPKERFESNIDEAKDFVPQGENERVTRVDQDLLKKVKAQTDGQGVLFRKVAPRQYERTVLIAPATVDLSQENIFETRDALWPHANFDHLSEIVKKPLSSLFMHVYYI
ncbi:alpha 1,2 mannosyltransferase [Lunasporangiospora selenospora]|uniref:Mannosyltransferase n=1 Tax=Lunasporangiospora selenospora TaxID=979761 RepID=A0A9P6KEI0_9FUNG|nr:alpha 1,2 mannosyltransferase [Lunasporangiospora selenospora]